MGQRANIVRYILLPEILPRISGLFKNGFFYTAYLIATIYGNAGLLPANHPYLNPQNIGRFGLRHVVAAAANNLVFSKKHIDQIFIFFVLLAGIGLFFMQILLLGVALFASNPVMANTIAESLSMFKNPSSFGALGPEQDIAFILLDRIFGTEGIYNSCVNIGGCTTLDGNAAPVPPTGVAPYPWPFHKALHALLAFYSSSIFVVGALVIVYFITTIVMEASQSGQPFGRRVNKAWAPVRFILFFALLIPINAGERNEGLNAAQIITLWTAKFGSNFATNAWSQFNSASINAPGNSLTDGYLTQQQNMIATPTAPVQELNALLQFLYVARTCQSAYALSHDPKKPLSGDNAKDIEAYVIRSLPATLDGNQVSENSVLLDVTDFTAALDFSAKGNITIRIGQRADMENGRVKAGFEKYQNMKGFVMPHCGDLTLTIESVTQPGTLELKERYYNMIRDIWTDNELTKYAKCTVQRAGAFGQMDGAGAKCTEIHDQIFTENLITHYRSILHRDLEQSIEIQRADGDSEMRTDLIKRGWAGGALWYNKIAEMNGAMTSAAFNLPKSSQLPLLMDKAAQANRSQSEGITIDGQFSQDLAEISGVDVTLSISEKEKLLLMPMRDAFSIWNTASDNAHTSTAPSGNIIIDVINGIFGTRGLFDMRNNANVHPLAQLTSLGKSLLDAATRNMMFGFGLMGGKNLFSGLTKMGSEVAGVLESFFFTLVATTIAIGVLLYYVLPLMPFIYFFFAVSGWVKSIFEAIVAMPLWALAHLRIDGNGLPGPGASNGYFLLLEIFLRPILILFGLLASIAIFAALVNVLNQIFDLVVANLAGHNIELESKIIAGSGPQPGLESKLEFIASAVDEFMFTVIYAIICYMMGLSCFKLVDTIPNQLMRYMGVSVGSFKENAGDPAAQLGSRIFSSTNLINNQITGSFKGDLPLILNSLSK